MRLSVWKGWKMIKRLNCTGKRYYIFMVLTIAVAIFYVALMCNKTMPFAEGWYTYYAQLINEKVCCLTKILNIFFAALHLFYCVCHALFRIWYFDTAVCWHPNVCNNRLRGIFVYYRNCWKKKGVDCCNFFRYSGYVSTVRSGSDFYDYIRLMDIFAVFTVLFLIRAVKAMQHSENQGVKVNLFLCGLFNSSS